MPSSLQSMVVCTSITLKQYNNLIQQLYPIASRASSKAASQNPTKLKSAEKAASHTAPNSSGILLPSRTLTSNCMSAICSDGIYWMKKEIKGANDGEKCDLQDFKKGIQIEEGLRCRCCS
jgi:hypothetical protein